MSELETMQQEIDRLKEQLNQLQEVKKQLDYKSRGIYRLVINCDGAHIVEDKSILEEEVNDNLRFDTEEKGEQALTHVKKLLKMIAIANRVAGDDGYGVDLEETFVFMTDEGKERFEQIYFEAYRGIDK